MEFPDAHSSWLFQGYFSLLGKISLQTSKSSWPSEMASETVTDLNSQPFVWFLCSVVITWSSCQRFFEDTNNGLKWELAGFSSEGTVWKAEQPLSVYFLCTHFTSLLHEPFPSLVFVYLLHTAWICFSKKVDVRMGGNRGNKVKERDWEIERQRGFMLLRKVHRKESCAGENCWRIKNYILCVFSVLCVFSFDGLILFKISNIFYLSFCFLLFYFSFQLNRH